MVGGESQHCGKEEEDRLWRYLKIVLKRTKQSQQATCHIFYLKILKPTSSHTLYNSVYDLKTAFLEMNFV